MSAPTIVSVLPNSPAEQHGIKGGEQILSINGCIPRDVIEYQLLIDEPQVTLEIDSGGIRSEVEIFRKTDTPLGIEVMAHFLIVCEHATIIANSVLSTNSRPA